MLLYFFCFSKIIEIYIIKVSVVCSVLMKGGFMDNNFEKLEAPSYSAEKVEVSNRDLRCLISSPYEQHITYINGFNDPVSVVERNGIRTIIPPQRDRNNINFIVRLTFYVPKSIHFDADFLLKSECDATVEFNAINKAGDKILSGNERILDTNAFSIDYVISRDKLDKRGGNIYLMERDIVISFHIGNKTPLHPASRDYQKERLLIDSNKFINETQFGFSIKIIDNNGMYGDRYVNLNGRAYRIPATRDRILTDGVYYSSSGHAIGNFNNCPPETHKYTFEEADKALSLYRSVEDALTYGDPIKARENELKELKMTFEEKQLIFNNEKLVFQQKITDQENEIKRRQIEHTETTTHLEFLRKQLDYRTSVDKIHRSDMYDQRSQQRKDWSEALKFLPTVIVAIGAGYVAWQKMKNPTG